MPACEGMTVFFSVSSAPLRLNFFYNREEAKERFFCHCERMRSNPVWIATPLSRLAMTVVVNFAVSRFISLRCPT
jgi:hypothetical protein